VLAVDAAIVVGATAVAVVIGLLLAAAAPLAAAAAVVFVVPAARVPSVVPSRPIRRSGFAVVGEALTSSRRRGGGGSKGMGRRGGRVAGCRRQAEGSKARASVATAEKRQETAG